MRYDEDDRYDKEHKGLVAQQPKECSIRAGGRGGRRNVHTSLKYRKIKLQFPGSKEEVGCVICQFVSRAMIFSGGHFVKGSRFAFHTISIDESIVSQRNAVHRVLDCLLNGDTKLHLKAGHNMLRASEYHGTASRKKVPMDPPFGMRLLAVMPKTGMIYCGSFNYDGGFWGGKMTSLRMTIISIPAISPPLMTQLAAHHRHASAQASPASFGAEKACNSCCCLSEWHLEGTSSMA